MSDRFARRYNKGRWMIEQERCRIDGEIAAPLIERESVAVGVGVESLLKRLGLANAGWASGLAADWESIVGKQVRLHTRPGVLQEGELTVFVDSSVWLSELKRYGMASMLRNVQDYAGKDRVKKLRLQIEPDRR